MGVLIGFTLHARQESGHPPAPQPKAQPFRPNVWLRIAPENTVTVIVGRSEMGQGVLTGLAMVVAEELDADWSHVRAQQAPAETKYGNQRTTGSASVSGSFDALRVAGARARALLIEAAARLWGVDASTCRTESGVVLHPPSGRRLTYGQLAGSAAAFPGGTTEAALPTIPAPLKTPSQFRLIGTRLPRLDTPAKVDGSAVFGLDVRIADMLFATVARCPVPGGTVARFDATRAQTVPGVRQILQIPSGVAVVADHTWAAMAGRGALDVTWNDGTNAALSSPAIRQQLAAQVPLPAAMPGAAHMVEASYETPYQAHVPMEPLNCTVRLQHGRCEVWTGTQDPQGAQAAAADASGVPVEQVSVQVPLGGGAFGRRASADFVTEALTVAKAVGQPVQVVWTREDDLQHGYYGPASSHRLRATLDGAGKLRSWQHGVAAQSIGSGAAAGAQPPYAIPSVHVSGADVSLGVPVTIWRGAEFTYSTFAIESFLDEVAATAGADPYQFRRGLLDATPRLKAVVDLAASKAGWGAALPPGWGRGMAACLYANTNTFVAEVAEVAVTRDGTVQVQRVVCAVDCGIVINPTLAEAQIEGSIVQGLSNTLKGEITFASGRVQQHNVDDYPLLRLNEMPTVEVYFVPSTERPSGLGEPALPPLAPAVANAIYVATGRRVRRLPIRPEDVR
jgi:isoquinoline 1-oxidoreductase beta subunit